MLLFGDDRRHTTTYDRFHWAVTTQHRETANGVFALLKSSALSKQTYMSTLPYRLRAREQRCNRMDTPAASHLTDRSWPMAIMSENRKQSKSFYYF